MILGGHRHRMFGFPRCLTLRPKFQPSVNPFVQTLTGDEQPAPSDEPKDVLGPVELTDCPHCCPAVRRGLLHCEKTGD
jgi:hypothetical protein